MAPSMRSFAPLFLSLATALPRLHSRQSTDTCATGVHVIAGSGDGAENIGGYGLLQTLNDGIVAAIPGSDSVSLPYPKDDPSGLNKVMVGGPQMVTYISDYANSCPQTKIVLIGYSAGGIIAMNAMCGSSPPWSTPAGALDPALNDNIVGAVIYGEEAHAAVSPFNTGTCTGDGRFPRAGASAQCPGFANKLRSYCNAEDPQCCQGFVPDAHFAYPDQYDAEAVQYIVDLYNQNPSGPSPSSSSAPPPPPPPSSTPAPAPSSMTQASSPASLPAETSSPVESPPAQSSPMESPPAQSSPAQSPPAQSPPAQSSPAQAPTSAPAAPPATTAAPSPPAGGNGGGNGGAGNEGSPSTPSPAVPSGTASVPEPETTSCPTDLQGAFEFPHLIVPISETEPNKAFGTSYNGKIDSTTSSIFNFDIPYDLEGKTCSLIFTLPKQEDLQYSSFTTSGTGGINIAALKAPADLQTSFSNAPEQSESLGTYSIVPGGAHAFATGPCAAGQRIGYEMSATGDYALDYFQASGEPIGLYVRVCK